MQRLITVHFVLGNELMAGGADAHMNIKELGI